MAKFFFALLLAVLVAVSGAQGEGAQRFRDIQCRREVQEMPLRACRQLLDRQVSGGLRVVVPAWMRSSGPRAQCCRQLQDVSNQCRCSAIRQMVRDFEQSMAPLEERCRGEQGYYGKCQKQEGGYYGERQQGGGYYGGDCRQQGGYYGGERRQQGGGYYGGDCRQQGGYYGGESRQQGGYYGGERCQQGGYYGETARQQPGGRCSQRMGWQQSGCRQADGEEYEQQQGPGYYGEQPKQNRGYIGFPPATGTRQGTTRVRLTKVRQYAQQLPGMCQIEPQECNIFDAGWYQA